MAEKYVDHCKAAYLLPCKKILYPRNRLLLVQACQEKENDCASIRQENWCVALFVIFFFAPTFGYATQKSAIQARWHHKLEKLHISSITRTFLVYESRSGEVVCKSNAQDLSKGKWKGVDPLTSATISI